MLGCHSPPPRRRFHWLLFLLSWCCCVGLVWALPRSPVLTFSRLYTAGVQAYFDRKWHKCILFMEMAIEDHRFYKESIIDCRLKCKQDVHKYTDDRKFTVLEFQDVYLQLALTERACVQTCRNGVLEGRPVAPISQQYWNEFDNGKPYIYLHYCYYKIGRMVDATSAAYTFFLKNPDHQDTIDNIQSYRKSFGVKDEEIVDMERKQYKEYRGKGEKAYLMEDWSNVITNFERALQEYYLEDERCRANCEGQYEHDRDPDFIHAVADHYISVLQCQVGCADLLSKIYVKQQPNYFVEHFHYLQFAYYKKEDYDHAVEACGTFLLFIPDDKDMLANKMYYIQKYGYHEAHFTPRKEALQYYKRQQMMEKMLEFVNVKYFMDDEDEEDIDEEEDDQIAEDLMENVEKDLIKGPNQDFYLKIFERIGIKILQSQENLQGPRFIAKSFTREGQCIELMYMINSIQPDKHGIRQLSVVEALELVKKESDYEMALRTLLKASEITRHYTGRFFNKTKFFIKDAKLVCRDPLENGEDSGPCVPQESGQCMDDTEVLEDYTNDAYTSVAYLTDNTDSEIYFLDRWRRKQSSSLPGSIKCGYVVGFEASDRHGIIPSKTQRCAMVVTYTSDRSHDNPVLRKARTFLLSLEDQRSATNNSLILQKFEKEGTTVVQANEELHESERVIADGLIDAEACSALVNLAKEGVIGDGYKKASPHTKREIFSGLRMEVAAESGAIIGDGYNEKDNFEAVAISPHTDNEIFEGLTIRRAIKLAKSGAVSQESVELYLSASERSRLFVEKFFNLTKPLYFDFTHLVCRTALEGEQTGRTDLSHPVHADNCQLNTRDGTCLRAFPAFVQRDYRSLKQLYWSSVVDNSAILYLNDDFEGGEFFFAHSNTSADVTLKPKCGRLVGFNAAHLHGVNSVLKGQRCAVAMWYTLDPNYKELARIQAQKVLTSMSSSNENVQESNTETSVHEEL